MAKQTIKSTMVTCEDGTIDYNIGINSNVDTDDKVQAFVDAFKSYARSASNICYGLPLNLILAMWGGESGWATGSDQQKNQNWSNMKYVSATNPVGNIGKGIGGWAIFEGGNHHATAFGNWFKNNQRYSALIEYLKGAGNPDINACIVHIAEAGYGGEDHDAYAELVEQWVKALINHSNLS